MRPIDMTFEHDGKRYFEVKNFAWATNRSVQNVRFLMSYGNKIRKLKVEYIGSRPFIPFSELTEFPFTVPGRNNDRVFHYDEEGKEVFA